MAAPDYGAQAVEALGELARAILLRDGKLASEWWARWEAGSEAAAVAAAAALDGEWKAAEAAYLHTRGPEGLAEMARALESLDWAQDAEGI